MKKYFFGAVHALILVSLSFSAHSTLIIPAGLSAGDNYHVIFVSSTARDATSSDIADYDAFVGALADAAGIGASVGVSWLALGSTATVDAIDHLATVFTDLSAPIYNQHGELVATNYADLWDGSLVSAVRYTETGNTLALNAVWTGTDSSGQVIPTFPLGGNPGGAGYGSATSSSSLWLQTFRRGIPIQYNLYGVSSQLTVSAVPVPAAAWLFCSGLLGLIGVARRV